MMPEYQDMFVNMMMQSDTVVFSSGGVETPVYIFMVSLCKVYKHLMTGNG